VDLRERTDADYVVVKNASRRDKERRKDNEVRNL
jgi:hypothetical protein